MFQCVDLAQHGLELVSPADPRFASFVAGIRECLQFPGLPPFARDFIPDEPDSSAVLLNDSGRTVACLAVEWVWEYEGRPPQTHVILSTGGRSLLIPSIASPGHDEFTTYWNTILPGSKRLLSDAHVIGNNADVRPPQLSPTGGYAVGGGATTHRAGKPSGVVIRLDGAFFDSGDFAGPNRCGLWEMISSERDLRLEIAGIASRGLDCGLSPSQIANRIDAVFSQGGITVPEVGRHVRHDDFAARHRQQLQVRFEVRRRDTSDYDAIAQVASWLDNPGPPLRRV